MGLLLSVLITCVGVLEVIACYTRFQVGYHYTEAKSNIRDIAKHYAVELRKHELHFEPGPPGTIPQEETLSELMRAKSSVRVQDHNLLLPSSSQGTPNPALKVPRNSVCGYDSPSMEKLQSPDIDISEAIDAIQEHENDASFWSRKSPSPYPDKSGLEVVESNFWRSRSPSPFPQDTETGTDATPELRNYSTMSPLLQTPDSGAFSLGSDLTENHHQNSTLVDSHTPTLRKHRSISPLLQTPTSEENWNKLDEPLSPSDLEVKMILESGGEELISIPRQPSPYPDILFNTVDDTEETQFDEDFLRSLDGVKPPKCDDRRRTFRKKRNSSSTSSRTSRDDKSLTSLDEVECDKRNNVDHQSSKEFIPVVEEESDLIHEEIPPEKCEHISKAAPDETVKVTKQEETLFEASISKQDTENKKAVDDKGKANLTFTEKVKDLEISVQLMVTVKGTSQGDKMEYTTNVTQDKVSALAHPETKDESVTETTEKASEFGNVKTSVTYGNSTVPATKSNINVKEITVSDEPKPNLKDLQISSQSLIHAERTVQDDVATSEDDFLKLYESFTELPEREKDKFLMRIGHKSQDNKDSTIADLAPPQTEVQASEIKPQATIIVKPMEDTIEHIESAIINFEDKQKDLEINTNKTDKPTQKSKVIDINETQIEKTIETTQDEKTVDETNEKTTKVYREEDTTVVNETEITDNKKSIDANEQLPSETKPDRIEQLKKESDVAQTSSDSSSETPPTIVENRLRRASQTAFEEASSVQSQEMLKRRVSNSEISPKQANQAFWLIFSAEYTNAMEKDWHSQHFSCWQCDESLTGQRYVLRDEHPYCVKCYEQVFANPCEKCTKTIGIDSKDLSYKEKHWHEACFQCTSCKESLVDKQFGAKGEKIYCGNCYDKQFASRCDGCTKIFHAGTKKMEYKNRQWHEQCFKCCKCENPIGTKSFIPREKDIYCAGCYEEKFATRCVKCNKAIQSGGVTYKNEPWHRECFTCTHCSKNLAGQRFTSRDDKPCCADCFGKLFAKRCTSCTEPITGIGGTRFISFEDRHWHNDCFICANCTTSLVGRGFITDETKIICPECAKERFM